MSANSPSRTVAQRDVERDAAYRRLDELLQRRISYYPRHDEPHWSELQNALAGVEEELWHATQDSPPVELDPERRRELEALAERPVFVLGYYKSGTTLLLNLLDGHPEIVALPGESRHFADLARRPPSDASALQREVHRRALKNVITPYGIPPLWLLGKPWKQGPDQYARFSRLLAQFARWRGERDPLAAVAQALAAVRRQWSPRVWVEKTPTHEFHVDRILAAYADARFVHVVRDPLATVGSISRYESRHPVADTLTAASELARSLSIALERQSGLAGRYVVVRYEDVVRHAERELRRLVDALGLGWDDSLLTPTMGGEPAVANSAVATRRVSGEIHRLSLGRPRVPRATAAVVAAFVGHEAGAFGYRVPRPIPLVRTVARALLVFRYRLRRR